MDYSYWKKLLHVLVDPAENGRLAAIMYVRYVLRMEQVHRDTRITKKVFVGLGGGMSTIHCLYS